MVSAENLTDLLEVFAKDSSLDLICAPVELYREGRFIYNSQVKPNFISNLIGQNNLCHQGIIYKKSVFNCVGPYDANYKLAGDYDHHFKCHLKGMKMGVSSAPIAKYDRGGRSDNFQAVFREYRKIWKKLAPELGKTLYLQNTLAGAAYLLRTQVVKSKLISPMSTPSKRFGIGSIGKIDFCSINAGVATKPHSGY